MELKDKVALVTGGGQGIGRVIGGNLAKSGAHVIFGDINLENAEKSAKAILANGGSASAILLNVADPENVKEVFDLIDDSIDIGELFDHANFESQDSVKAPLSTKIKKIIKDLLPISIVKKLDLNYIIKEKPKLSNLPGYPWSDSVAMHDWKIITQVIENNKELIKKETL